MLTVLIVVVLLRLSSRPLVLAIVLKLLHESREQALQRAGQMLNVECYTALITGK